MTIHPPYRFPTEPLEWENLQVAKGRPPELKTGEHDPEAGALHDHAKARFKTSLILRAVPSYGTAQLCHLRNGRQSSFQDYFNNS